MIESHTAVLERAATITGTYPTEPYETAWAKEAIFFIREHGAGADGRTHAARVQISPDGLHWCDEGTELTVQSGAVSHAKVTNFGGWLRLSIAAGDDELVVSIHLALKG